MARKKGKARVRQAISSNHGQIAGRDVLNKIKLVMHSYNIIMQDSAASAREQAALVKARIASVTANRWRWAYVVAGAGWLLDTFLSGK